LRDFERIAQTSRL